MRDGEYIEERMRCALTPRGRPQRRARGIRRHREPWGGTEDDGACGGKLVQMVHDLDLIAVDREDVLLAGIGVGVLACGDGRRIGICGLVSDGADIAFLYKPFDSIEVPAGVVGLAVLVLVFQIGELGPVGAEGDESVLGNTTVLVLPGFEVLDGQDKVGICGALLVLVDHTERMHKLDGFNLSKGTTLNMEMPRCIDVGAVLRGDRILKAAHGREHVPGRVGQIIEELGGLERLKAKPVRGVARERVGEVDPAIIGGLELGGEVPKVERGHGGLLSSGFLLMLKRRRDGSISTTLRYVLDCDSNVFRWRGRCVSPH